MTTDSVRSLLRTVLDDLAAVVDRIDDGQLHDPTPCTEYDVSTLRGHVAGWVTTFAAGFADPEGKAPPVDDYRAADRPGDDIRAGAEQLDEALAGGAAGRPLRLGDSAMPGEMALDMILWEYQVHGWDLARATGQQWSPPEEAAERSLGFAPGMLNPQWQGEGKAFGPRVPVPDDASAFERLLGLSGRDPGWQRPL